MKASEERFCQKYAKNIRHCAVIKNGTAKANEKLLCRKFAKKIRRWAAIKNRTAKANEKPVLSENSRRAFHFFSPRSAEFFSRIFAKKVFLLHYSSIVLATQHRIFVREFSEKKGCSFTFAVPIRIAAQRRMLFENFWKEKVLRSLSAFHFLLPRRAEFFSRIFDKTVFCRFYRSIFYRRAVPIFFDNFRTKKKGFSSALIIPVFLAAPNFFREFFSSPHVSLSRSAELFSRIFDKMVFFCSCHSNFCYHVVPIFVDNIRKKRKGFSSALIIPLFFCHAQRRIFFENFCKNLKSYFVRFHLSICC